MRTPTSKPPSDNASRDWFVRRRCDALKKIIDVNSAFPDSHLAAKQLFQILKEVEESKKASRFDILRRVWPTARDTKHLYKLLVQPGKAAPKELQKRPKAYWRVARAAALESGLPEDTYLPRLFEGTQVARSADKIMSSDATQSDVEQNFVELAALIGEMTQAIVRRCGLNSLNQTIATTAGQYDAHDECIRYLNPGMLLAHGPLAESFEVVDEWPPIPSIELYRVQRYPTFRSILRVSTDHLSEDMTLRDAFVLALGAEQDKSWKSIPVRVTSWREVRLAIGPADASLQAQPLFELRTVFGLSGSEAGSGIKLLTPWRYGHAAEQVVVRIGKHRHIGAVDLRPIDDKTSQDSGYSWQSPIPLDWPIVEDGRRLTLQPEHCYATWRFVTPDLCQELLDLGLLEAPYEILTVLPRPTEQTLAPVDTMAARVEEAIVSGVIENSLEAEAKRLNALVAEYRAGRRTVAIERHQAARNRWQKQ